MTLMGCDIKIYLSFAFAFDSGLSLLSNPGIPAPLRQLEFGSNAARGYISKKVPKLV